MIQPPADYGHELVGEIVAVGKRVDPRWRIGMRVITANSAHADAPAWIYTLAHGHNFANQFVPKNGRRLNHFGVIAALPDFEISAISKREPDTHQDFVGGESGHVNHFNAKVFAAIEHSRGHF